MTLPSRIATQLPAYAVKFSRTKMSDWWITGIAGILACHVEDTPSVRPGTGLLLLRELEVYDAVLELLVGDRADRGDERGDSRSAAGEAG